MWINGFKILQKPILHLHTQYNRSIPWSSIDMDFINLNQAAHGDREHGFIMSRMRLDRKVVVGFWQDAEVQDKSAPGAARRPRGMTGRAPGLPVLATICVKWL
jgi:L-arabinose isomerase